MAKKLHIAEKRLDRKSFELLFREHFKGLSFFALEYVKDHDIAREIVQEAFTGLWEKRQSIELDKSPKAYLGSTVKNRCLNYLRDNKKYDRTILEFEGIGDEHSYNDQDELVTNELKEKIEAATDSLPDKCREIFVKNRIDNLKYQEIADELDISVKTVEAQMSKALRIMREKLAEYLNVIIIIIEILRNL